MFMLISWQFMSIYSVSASPTAKMYVHPQDQTVSSSFSVDINVTDVADLYNWAFKLNYSTSIITATSITEGPFLKQDAKMLWVSANDDYVYKVFEVDLSNDVISWDTGTSRPYGVEYVNGFIYYVDYGTDDLYNKTVAGGDGSPASWDLSGKADTYGLGWDGTYFLIADYGNDEIDFVSFSDPSTVVKSISVQDQVQGVTFDGTYYWTCSAKTDTVTKVDGSGAGLGGGIPGRERRSPQGLAETLCRIYGCST